MAENPGIRSGGNPGSQGSVGSTSIFQEPQPMPPIRIVEGGRLRKDLEREYLIRSRTPALNALDLRAKIAANNVAKQRIHGLAARYGIETVTAVMREMIAYTERRLRQRLRELPDGRWEHRLYLDDAAHSRHYRFHVAMEKRDDRLSFDYTQCGEQAPAVVNCTQVGLTAAVLTSVFPTLCFDLPWSPAGVLRVVEIRSRPGTVAHAQWPAGVAKATTAAIPMANTVAWVCLARMLSASSSYHAQAMAPWMTVAPVQELFGTDQRGEAFGATLLDNMAGGGGASASHDGIDTGGNTRALRVHLMVCLPKLPLRIAVLQFCKDLSRADAIALSDSFSAGMRSTRSIFSTSKSMRSVPWNRRAFPSKAPPVPEILRPSTSISLRGR